MSPELAVSFFVVFVCFSVSCFLLLLFFTGGGWVGGGGGDFTMDFIPSILLLCVLGGNPK